LSELELELFKVKRELTEVKIERDFIKKCATYFAQESRRDIDDSGVPSETFPE
jgi:transposase